jgi:hypothetical protein
MAVDDEPITCNPCRIKGASKAKAGERRIATVGWPNVSGTPAKKSRHETPCRSRPAPDPASQQDCPEAHF